MPTIRKPNTEHLSQWMYDTADKRNAADRRALETVESLLFFYEQVMRIMHDTRPAGEVCQAIIDEVFEDKRADPLNGCCVCPRCKAKVK